MARLRHILALAGIVVLALAMLAGCASVTPTQAPTNAPTATTAPQPVTLRFSWWGGDNRHKATLDAIALYHETYPNVTITGEYEGGDSYQQKMMTAFAGGTAPDIIQIDQPWLNDLSQQDLLMDLTANANMDLTQFEPKILDSFCTLNGKLLGLPTGSNGYTFIASKAFLDKFGISADTVFTWDSFLEAGKKVHAQDANSYLSFWDPIDSTRFVDEYVRKKTGTYWISDDFKVTCTSADLAEAFTMLKSLYDNGAFLPLGETLAFAVKMEQNPKWLSGNIGGTSNWASMIATWKASTRDTLVTMPLPVVKDGKVDNIPYRPAQLLSINNKSAAKDETAKFINWFLNDPAAVMVLKTVRSIPTSKIAMKTLQDAGVLDADVAAAITRTLANPAPAAPFVAGDAEIQSILIDEFENVVYGKHTPQEAADIVIERTQTKLDALKAG